MSKEHILNEIRRTASVNGGRALGRERFEKETGIKYKDWYGRYWARWGDALREAGLEPNQLQGALPDTDTLPKLVALIRELGRYPTYGEIRMREHTNEDFPSVFARHGAKQDWIRKLADYSASNPGHDDIAAIVAPLIQIETASSDEKPIPDLPDGFVYLALMKVGREKRYKIGKADIVGRRAKQVGVNLPEELELIHVISTDDAYGIESYWHKRFAEKRRGGEWFDLTADEVRAFKRRKFM